LSVGGDHDRNTQDAQGEAQTEPDADLQRVVRLSPP
jgi:hypothetical protein